MKEVEEGLDRDGHLVLGIVEVVMIADGGHLLKAFLHGFIYFPGLN
jgi:hypothetical protein